MTKAAAAAAPARNILYPVVLAVIRDKKAFIKTSRKVFRGG
jgi:hypothetical protein